MPSHMSITKVKDPDGIVHLVVQRTWQAYCGRFMYVGDVVTKTNPPLSCIACVIKKT